MIAKSSRRGSGPSWEIAISPGASIFATCFGRSEVPGSRPGLGLLQRLHEELDRLGARDGDFAIEDEERHARNAEGMGLVALGFDGIAEAMTEAGKPANSLIARLCPNDLETLRAQALSTLSSEHRPTGIICRGERMLNLVLPIVQQLGLKVPEDVELVYETFSTAHVGHVPYPCVETSQPFEQIARKISGMLREQRSGTEPATEHVRVPVEVRAATRH